MDSVTKNAPVDNLETTGLAPIKDGGTIAQAGVVKAGTVLGKITASGKLVACDKDATDGSEKPFGVLYEDVDTTDADKVAVIYLQGSFNKDALIFVDGTTIADKWDE